VACSTGQRPEEAVGEPSENTLIRLAPAALSLMTSTWSSLRTAVSIVHAALWSRSLCSAEKPSAVHSEKMKGCSRPHLHRQQGRTSDTN
jgi:hypothetical protein